MADGRFNDAASGVRRRTPGVPLRMRVVIIGGSGHIGTYLTPRLVEAGHFVVCVSRGQREPYVAHETWSRVESVTLDRTAEEAAGTFGGTICDLHADCVIDLTAY